PATLIFQRPTLAALAAHLADDVLGETAGGTEMPAAPAAAAGLGDESGEGTAGDLAGLLARELAALRQEGGR
ncbi:MAG TPA: hypothetical protein VMW75_03205, partial [Thermoanaerobaculia bacterium]|nr:hypothetical protein [Thermoanaerobaculia bacterium]